MLFQTPKSSQNRNSQSGFTLIEIIVSTAIFVTVVASLLALFNYTLIINRRVQSLREITQGTRTFTETLTREIRNGRIDYSGWALECDPTRYTRSDNNSLAIISQTSEKLCFYLAADGTFNLKRENSAGTVTEPIFGSNRFRIIPGTLHFYVFPKTDPNAGTAPYPAIQPFVTINAQFELKANASGTASLINYQSTISTDVYDTYRRN
jgi:prepilin-type N-terminal cleavage/methylation domain-containing protein